MSRTLARGKLKVDATRAIGKLREHLLVDRHLYLCELCRAAVAWGVERIDVHFDADDVILDAPGITLTTDVAKHLFDHLLVEAEDAAGLRLQRLALGVNAALGLEPKFVDILRLGPKRTTRIRYTSDLIERSAEPEAKVVAPPRDAPPRGLRLHVRHRVGWEVVRRTASDAVPREVGLLVEAAADLDVPLTINGAAPKRNPQRSLLRVPIEVHGLRRGWVEVLPAGAGMSAEFLELGVRLVTGSWTPAFIGSEAVDGPGMPLRLVADAEALPTNASRSALQQDAPLLQQVHLAGSDATLQALQALTELGTGRETSDPSVEVQPAGRSAIEDALGAIVCWVVEAMRRDITVDPTLRELLELPLLRDATNRPLTVSACLAWRSVAIMRRDEPLPEALAPWVENVVWLRGRVVENVLGAVEEINVEAVLDEVARGEERRQRLMAHAPTDPTIAPRSEHVARGPIASPTGPLAGLRGEVAIGVVDRAIGHPGSTLHVYFEGRLLETLTIPESSLPLCIDAAVQWDRALLPTWGWDGVLRGPRLDQALDGVVRAATELAAQLAAELPRLTPEAAAVAASVVRAAVLSVELGDDPTDDALRRARVWPLTDGTRTSYFALYRYVLRTGALCTVVPQAGAVGRAPDHRPVVVLDAREQERLAARLEARLVPYARGVGDEAQLQELAAAGERQVRAVLDRLAPGAGPTLPVAQGHVRGFIRLAPLERVVAVHAGVELGTVESTAAIPNAVVALDDDSIVPTPSWDGIEYAPRWERDAIRVSLGELLANAIVGDPEAVQRAPLTNDQADRAARAFLLELLGDRLRAQRLRGKNERRRKPAESDPVVERLRDLPLLDELDEGGHPVRVSLAHVTKRRRKHVPLLAAAPGFETFDWFPLVADGPVLGAVRTCLPNAVIADLQLTSRRQRAERERRRRALFEREQLPVSELAARADPDTPRVTTEAEVAPLLTLTLGLPREPLGTDAITCEVLFAGHPLCMLTRSVVGFPVIARCSLDDPELVDDWERLNADGTELVRLHVAEAIKELGSAIARHAAAAPTWLFTNVPALELLAAAQRTGAWPIVVTELARHQRAWPTVQGNEHRFKQLRREGKKLWYGRDRYPTWYGRRASRAPLDQPTLYLPQTAGGVALSAIFTAAGYELVDLTEAFAELQERRASSDVHDAPRLTGEPLHPAFRVSLHEIEVGEAEGELELLPAAAAAQIMLFDLTGKSRGVEANLPFPIRAVARVDAQLIDAKLAQRVVRGIAKGAARLLDRLASRLDELPEAAADCSRLLFFHRLERSSSAPKALARAPLFPDVQGRRHSFVTLTDVAKEKPLGYTPHAPPYPRELPERPILRLTAAQAKLISKWVPLESAANALLRQQLAEGRASAPQRAVVALSPELRRQCLVTAPIEDKTLGGEVGVLRPGARTKPHVELLVNRRPLAKLKVSSQLPIVGVANDDSIAPNRAFTYPRKKADARRVIDQANLAARTALETLLRAPRNARASTFLHDADAGDGLRVTGSIWLPQVWPERPLVHLCLAAVPHGTRMVPAVTAAPRATGLVPVAASLVVWEDPSQPRAAGVGPPVSRLLLREAAYLFEQARGTPEELARYRWDFALLGIGDDPQVQAADGSSVAFSALCEQLVQTGQLWWTDGNIAEAGTLPDAPEAIVLPHTEIALLDVLQKRTTKGTLRRLGEPNPAPVPVVTAESPPPTGDLLGIVVDWLRSVTSTPAPTPRRAPASDPLSRAVLERLVEQPLLADHIVDVERHPSPRAVRYDVASRTILLATQHPLLDPIDPSRPEHQTAITGLVAAATSEINRALVAVTDATERKVLMRLLG